MAVTSWLGPVLQQSALSDAGSVQDAARIAALEVLREVQQQGNLGVVGSSPPVKKTPEQDAPSSVQSSSANGVPKGYKGDPSDTRADAFRKMQVWPFMYVAPVCGVCVITPFGGLYS